MDTDGVRPCHMYGEDIDEIVKLSAIRTRIDVNAMKP